MNFIQKKHKYISYYLSEQTHSKKEFSLIFFHGFMGRASDWFQLIPLINNNYLENCKICAFDIPGHGDSHIGSLTLSHNDITQILCECILHENLSNPVLIGYSLGGRIALQIVQHIKNIIGLFLESCSFGISDPQERKDRLSKDKQLLSTITSKISNYNPQKNSDESISIEFKNFLLKWYSQPLFTGIKESIEYDKLILKLLENDVIELQKSLDILSIGNFEPLWDKIKNYKTPIYYICGEKDVKYSQEGKTLQQYNNTTVRVIDGCSHNIHFQNSSQFITELNTFLKFILNKM